MAPLPHPMRGKTEYSRTDPNIVVRWQAFHPHPVRSTVRHRTLAAVTAAIITLGSLGLPTPAIAEGETSQELQATADQLMAEVREKVQAYNDAVARADDLKARVAKTEDDIAGIEARLPGERERAAKSIKSLYRMSQDDTGLVGLILCSENFESFISNVAYLESVTEYNNVRVRTLVDEQANLETAKATLEVQREEADAEAEAADEALAAAQEAAQRAQAAADAARAVEEARAAAAAAYGGGGFTQAATPEEAIATTNALAEQVGITVAGDTATQDATKEAFVAKWGPRIDAYLAGRPLQGQGATFAEAAWDAGIDPRWSAAESMVESGGGAACFAAYNAYGWLGRGAFSSWEEGVREHATYLRGMYGTSPTPAAAALYLVGDPSAVAESSEYYQSLMAEVARI